MPENFKVHLRRAKFFQFVCEVFRRFRLRETFFDRTKILEIIAGTGAIETVQKSWKPEPSPRFFGRLIPARRGAQLYSAGGRTSFGGDQTMLAPEI